MEPSVWRFLLFLGSELAFLAASIVVLALVGLLIIKNKAIKNGYMLTAAVALEIVTPVFLFVFVWILTGQNYLPLFAVIGIVSVALILAGELIWLILGARNVPWGAQVVWSQYEFQQSVPAIHKTLQAIGAVAIFVAFPAYIGYGYFGDAFASPDWPRYVMRGTLVLLVGVAWATMLPLRLYLMTSRDVGEDVRSRMFIGQLSQSVSVLLLMSLFIWTISGGGQTVQLLGEYFVFSPIVAYVVGAYLVALLVVPYLIGHYRSKQWLEQLASERQELIEALAKGLLSPNLARVGSALEEAKRGIQAAFERLSADPAMGLAGQLGESTDPQHLAARLALGESAKQDPRFRHAKQLSELSHTVQDCEAQLAENRPEQEKRQLLAGYAKLLEKDKEARDDSAAGTKPIVLVGLATLAGSVLNPIVSSVGKFIATQMGISVD